jgi:ectoine hydroxylase-related dioxygenase (phytanoyl-CoA dioxygenase family)
VANRANYPIIGWTLEPGDAVFFHMLALHGAAGVSGTNRRRVLSVRFIGDDIRHAPRRWKTSPPAKHPTVLQRAILLRSPEVTA